MFFYVKKVLLQIYICKGFFCVKVLLFLRKKTVPLQNLYFYRGAVFFLRKSISHRDDDRIRIISRLSY